MIIQSVKKMNDVYNNNKFDNYRLTTTDGIIMSVPVDEENRSYQAIMKWVAEGNTIEEAD